MSRRKNNMILNKKEILLFIFLMKLNFKFNSKIYIEKYICVYNLCNQLNSQ